jgi:hypothetical protein
MENAIMGEPPSHNHDHPTASIVADHGEKSASPDAAMIQDLVAANHILFDQGWWMRSDM